MLKNNVKYIGFVATASALVWLLQSGVVPIEHPFRPGEYIIDEAARQFETVNKFFQRKDVQLTMTWLFATSGSTLTLPSDFNTSNNQINAIGSGVGGGAGGAGSPCCPIGGCTGGGASGGAGGGGVC